MAQAALALAATVLIAAMISTAYFYGKGSFQAGLRSTLTQPVTSAGNEAPVSSLNQRIAELTAVNLRFQMQMDGLKAELRKANARLIVSDTAVESCHRIAESSNPSATH